MRTHLVAAILLSFGPAAAACSQQIRIVVVEAQHGKPVSDECLNISLGSWHGADLLGSTNQDGVVILSIDKDQVSVEPVPGRKCNGMASVKPLPVTTLPTSVSIVPDWYVSCQYSKKLEKDPAWLRESPAQRIPSFSVQEVLIHGMVATNSCSNLNPLPKPGHLVLVVRKRTFWEGMKS
jgi:hypothetical protein